MRWLHSINQTRLCPILLPSVGFPPEPREWSSGNLTLLAHLVALENLQITERGEHGLTFRLFCFRKLFIDSIQSISPGTRGQDRD
jgi:hypothetical protein